MNDRVNDYTVSYVEVDRAIQIAFHHLYDAAHKLEEWDRVSGEDHLAQIMALCAQARLVKRLSHTI